MGDWGEQANRKWQRYATTSGMHDLLFRLRSSDNGKVALRLEKISVFDDFERGAGFHSLAPLVPVHIPAYRQAAARDKFPCLFARPTHFSMYSLMRSG